MIKLKPTRLRKTDIDTHKEEMIKEKMWFKAHKDKQQVKLNEILEE